MENELDLLGFDPTQLSVFNQNEAPRRAGNENIYYTRPADSVSEDGHYRSVIKIIYSPFDLKHSVLEQQSYSMHDENGWFHAVSSLTNNDTNCPIFKAWKKCRYAPEGSVLNQQSTTVDKGGKGLFDKRFARYVTIQVLEDKNQPDLEGKYMFWKLPKSIWDMINAKMNPSKESGKSPVPVMDFLFGRSIDLDVIPGPDDKLHPERKTRETKYMGEISEDVVSCTNPDKSPLLTSAEQDVLDKYVFAMEKVWRSKDADLRLQMTQKINADPNTAELQKVYRRVLETIKTFCPNLNEELGYKPWDAELTARVQKWIDVVLSGNDPAQVSAAPEAVETVGVQPAVVQQTTATPVADPFSPSALGSEDDGDLPF